MKILTCAINYTKNDVHPFIQSLKGTGYKDDIICICNGSPAEQYLRDEGVEVIKDIDNGYHINSRRFFLYKEILRGVDEPVIISDIRDVVFLSNPATNMPTEGINVFCEHEAMTIGSCPYNSHWMMSLTGKADYFDKQIVCAGITSGYLTEYCMVIWEIIRTAPVMVGIDQAAHNHIVYSGRLDTTIHRNPEPVYTVGYVPRETIMDLHNACMVHQYDRHNNLKARLQW